VLVPPLGGSSPCKGPATRRTVTLGSRKRVGPLRTTKQGDDVTDKTYEEPEIRVLGEVTDLTQMSKPGIFFDFPFSSEGNTTPFPHHRHHIS
jgi:hypothetical protein